MDVDINGDTVVELDETIVMTLDALPTGLTDFELDNGSDAITISDGVAVHTITNEDSATITVNDITGAEAVLAAANQVVTFTLNGDVDEVITGSIVVSDVTAREAVGSGSGVFLSLIHI